MNIRSKETKRRRGPYKKTLRSCPNCKIRGVKCDETRPQCQRCKTYGVICNYGASASVLQMARGESMTWEQEGFQVFVADDFKRAPPAFLCPNITSTDRFDKTSSFSLDKQSRELLSRFWHRTAFTMGTPSMVDLHQIELTRLSIYSPCLMHAILSVTASHDRYLKLTPSAGRRSLLEIFHTSRCAALLGKKLSAAIHPHDRDALWSTAASLGAITFSSLEWLSPDEVWPLTRPDPSDLEWLWMIQEGKAAVWSATDPMRPESIFRAVSVEYNELHAPIPAVGAAGIPAVFRRMCSLDDQSTVENNPYFTAAHTVMELEALPPEEITVPRALRFMTFIWPPFKSLLKRKDPAALLLLAMWYAKARQSVWWLDQRAALEGRAICIYLRRHHSDTREIQELLPWD